MSYFEKFMKDIEEKQARKRKAQESVAKDDQHHVQRERVRLYSERWQNSVRWIRGKNEKKSK